MNKYRKLFTASTGQFLNNWSIYTGNAWPRNSNRYVYAITSSLKDFKIGFENEDVFGSLLISIEKFSYIIFEHISPYISSEWQ